MTKDKTGEVSEVKEVIEKVEHKNIFEALSAFQGENPEIIRDKKVVIEKKAGGTFEFMYAPIDSVFKVVRPLLAKHGLSVVHVQGQKEGQIVCALYHETYDASKTTTTKHTDGMGTTVEVSETNVIRSMPITVRRAGDMKDIGGDSTYARRYTLAEVLGIASDDDNDIADQQQKRGEAAISSMFERAKGGIEKAKTIKELDASIGVLGKGLNALAEGKTPSLGLDKEQHEELLKMAEERKMAMSENKVDKTDPAAPAVPGANDDAGGVAPVKPE